MYYYNLKQNIEPKGDLKQVLGFLDYYGNKGAIGKDYISFSDGIEFKSIYSLDFFKSLLQLHLESAIDLELKKVLPNDFGITSNEFKKELNSYKNTDTIGKLLGINKSKYDILSLRFNWDNISQKIKYLDCFSYNVSINNYAFMNLLFSKITSELGFLNQDREKTSNYLYDLFLEKTNSKKNYHDMIEFFFKFDDYIENKKLILPILCELSEKGNLKIEKSYISKGYIYFEISHIIDISKELFIEIAYSIKELSISEGELEEIKKIEYTEKGVKINDQFWVPKDSQKTEDFLLLLSMYFFENPKTLYIHNRILLGFYDKKKDLLKSELILTEKNIQNSYMKTLSKKLSEEYTGNFLQMNRGLIEAKKDF